MGAAELIPQRADVVVAELAPPWAVEVVVAELAPPWAVEEAVDMLLAEVGEPDCSHPRLQ